MWSHDSKYHLNYFKIRDLINFIFSNNFDKSITDLKQSNSL